MKNLIALCLLVGLFFVSISNSYVSSANETEVAKCAMMKFDRAYKNAKAIFVGEVIGIEKEGNKKTFEFRVKKFWKGIEDTKVKVTVYENRRYQAIYKVGESFLVYAKDDEKGGFWDGRCSRSRNMQGYAPTLKEDMDSLGDAKTCISLSKEKDEEDLKEKGE